MHLESPRDNFSSHDASTKLSVHFADMAPKGEFKSIDDQKIINAKLVKEGKLADLTIVDDGKPVKYLKDDSKCAGFGPDSKCGVASSADVNSKLDPKLQAQLDADMAAFKKAMEQFKLDYMKHHPELVKELEAEKLQWRKEHPDFIKKTGDDTKIEYMKKHPEIFKDKIELLKKSKEN